jgi:hypothetical protein
MHHFARVKALIFLGFLAAVDSGKWCCGASSTVRTCDGKAQPVSYC